MPRWLKLLLKVIGSLILLVLIVLIGLSIYVANNKAKVIALVTDELNKNIDGKLVVGNVKTSFFESFPGLSINLHDVTLKDKQWATHHHTLLTADNFSVSVNTSALLKGTISIDHIDISKASIDLFTDTTGYSNTAVFKKNNSKKDPSKGSGSSSTQLNKFSLNDVLFTVDDRKAHKLFKFAVDNLSGKMKYPDTGFMADIHLKVVAKSMAFNTLRGSFIKDKLIEGNLAAGYNSTSGLINVKSNDFSIGGDAFSIIADFNTGKKPADFAFHIAADNLLWGHASQLLAPNIAQRLNLFNLDKPIAVTALISGSFGGGDPLLYVTAIAKNNKLSTPGGSIDDISFKGVFTNNNVKGKGFTDENSVIRLLDLNGTYNHLPFKIDTGSIVNLVHPIATGNFKSSFPVADLNYLFGSGVAKFSNGTADMDLHYKADIVNYRINKPIIAGMISLKNADINYVPRNLTFKNTSVSLNFKGDDLFISNIHLQSGRSVVLMNGHINNFLNLYYNDPDKIVLDWEINSPQLYLAEFLGFLSSRQQSAAATKSRQNSGNVVDQLSTVLNKAQAEIHLHAANVHYKKFLATNALAEIHLSEDGIEIRSMSVRHANGLLKINGVIVQDNKQNTFKITTVVGNVDVHDFFYAFDNFGLKDITYQNLKGYLSAAVAVNGRISNAGDLIPGSMFGTINLSLRNAVLLNYKPLISVGKFVFPFRNLNEISLKQMDAKFDLRGDKIIINPFQLNSSIINADIAGTYALTKGTDITMDIPLRDPKKDAGITDEAELAKRRNRGIVVHIRAKDDENGKMKIGWNKDHKILPF